MLKTLCQMLHRLPRIVYISHLELPSTFLTYKTRQWSALRTRQRCSQMFSTVPHYFFSISGDFFIKYKGLLVLPGGQSLSSTSLFVFSITYPKHNARPLLTPVCDPAFCAHLHGSKHFLLHGSSYNHLFQRFWLAVGRILTDMKTVGKATMGV